MVELVVTMAIAALPLLAMGTLLVGTKIAGSRPMPASTNPSGKMRRS